MEELYKIITFNLGVCQYELLASQYYTGDTHQLRERLPLSFNYYLYKGNFI